MSSRSSRFGSTGLAEVATVVALLAAALLGGCKDKKASHQVAPPIEVTPTPTAQPSPVVTADPTPSPTASPGEPTPSPTPALDWDKLFAEAKAAKPTDLQVLPKDWSGEQVVDYMNHTVDEALGMRCEGCHPTGKFTDDNPKKARAREMMTMVVAVAHDYFRGKAKVGCMTCHRGKAKPDPAP